MKVLLLTEAPRPTPLDLGAGELDAIAGAAGRDALVQAAKHGSKVTGLVDGALKRADARTLASAVERNRRARMKTPLPRDQRPLRTIREIHLALLDWDLDIDVRSPDDAEPLGAHDAIVVDVVTSWSDAAQRIVSHHLGRETPVLALSDGAFRIDLDRLAYSGRRLRAGYVDILNQPVPDRFLELLREVERRDDSADIREDPPKKADAFEEVGDAGPDDTPFASNFEVLPVPISSAQLYARIVDAVARRAATHRPSSKGSAVA